MARFGLWLVRVLRFAFYYAHVQNPISSLPVPSLLSERLARALDLFNSTFTIPFRIVFVLGLLVCPFVKRLRWFALPLCVACQSASPAGHRKNNAVIASWGATSRYGNTLVLKRDRFSIGDS